MGSAPWGVAHRGFFPYFCLCITRVCWFLLAGFSRRFLLRVVLFTFWSPIHFRWIVGFGPFGHPFGFLCGRFFFFLRYLFGSTMVFLCATTCVVHAPVAIVAHKKSRVLSMLEEAVDFDKLSVVQFIPKGLIRLTFKDPADKYRLASQGSVMLDNMECSLTPSDRPNSLVYVHHFSAEGDDALLCEEFRHYARSSLVNISTSLGGLTSLLVHVF